MRLPGLRFPAVSVLALAAGLAGCTTTMANSGGTAAPGTDARVGPSATTGRSAEGNYLAAEHAGLERDTGIASDYFAKALSADPNNPAILERAFLLDVAQGDISGAADLANRMIAVDPSSRMARLILALDDLKAGRFADAGTEIDSASGRDPSDVVWATVRAWSYAGQKQTDQAVALLTSDSAKNNLGPFAAFHQALVLEYAGRTADADKAYSTALSGAEGKSVRLVEAYGRFLQRNNRTPEAIKLYEANISVMPDNPVVSTLLARAKAGKADTRPFIANPAEGAAEALYGIAVVLSGEHSAELPLVYVQLALYLHPHLDIGLALRGELSEAEEDWDGAAKSFAEIPPDSALAPYATVSLARDLAHLERYSEAEALLTARLKKAPDDVDALVTLGDINRSQEKWNDAAATYGKALAVAGQDQQWQILYARGVSLERAGNWPEAESLLQKALVLQPGQPQILNYLGYSWIDRGTHLKEALELIGKAVAAKPDDGYIVDSLGWAYYRLGDYANATRFLEHAVELKPDDATINDHLGDAYWRVGRKLEARFQWDHALAFKPEPEDAKKIADKLKNGLGETTGVTASTVPGTHS